MTTKRQIRIAVTGGGTGGHVGPALATIQAVRDLSQGQPWTPVFLYLGSAGGLEKELAEKAGLDFCSVQSGKLRRASHWRGLVSRENLADIARVPVGVAQSLRVLQKFRPDALLATGGYVSVPPTLAAFVLRVPILIHEQTVQVGLANKICALAATRIALSFADAARYLPRRARARAWETGNPIREIVFGGNKERAVARFGFLPADDAFPCVYVTGGAQGARVVNSALEAILPDVLSRCRVLHQCGPAEAGHFAAFAQTLPPALRTRYWTAGFVGDEIGDVFALADLIVGRSGAGTVAEAAALGLPALYVPLVPTGGDEQTKNARRVVDAGGAILLPASDLSPARLLHEWDALLSDMARLREMGKSAHRLARPHAARDLARALLALAGAAPAPDAPALWGACLGVPTASQRRKDFFRRWYALDTRGKQVCAGLATCRLLLLAGKASEEYEDGSKARGNLAGLVGLLGLGVASQSSDAADRRGCDGFAAGRFCRRRVWQLACACAALLGARAAAGILGVPAGDDEYSHGH